MAVVEVINSGHSKDAIMMHLLRTLFFIRAHWEIVVRAEDIPGRQNGLADAISRNNRGVFFTQAPRASRIPIRLRPEITRLLMTSWLDWTSPTWSQQLGNCLKLDWPTRQERPNGQEQGGTSRSVRGQAGTPSQ